MSARIDQRIVAVAVASACAAPAIKDWLVVHGIAGRDPLHHAARTLSSIGPGRLLVMGASEAQATWLADLDATAETVTAGKVGHAIQTIAEGIAQGDLLVAVPEALPLLDPRTLVELIASHRAGGADVSALVAESESSHGYFGASASILGEREPRILPAEGGNLRHDRVRALLVSGLDALETDPVDFQSPWDALLDRAVGTGKTDRETRMYTASDPWETQRIDSAATAGAVCNELNRRLVELAIQGGAIVLDPATTWIDADVTVGAAATILPGTHLEGRTILEPGAVVGPHTTLRDTFVAATAVVTRSQADQTAIGAGAHVGPFVQLRPGTQVGARVKIGSFVELKNADLGEGAKVPHLIYLGDVSVGAGGNIGGGSITANYDGEKKHRTVIGSEVRIGSNNTLVAPLSVGDGAYTGSGTVVRQDVPPGSLAVSAGEQRNIEGWVLRKRPGSPSAEAAERALGQKQ